MELVGRRTGPDMQPEPLSRALHSHVGGTDPEWQLSPECVQHHHNHQASPVPAAGGSAFGGGGGGGRR